MNGKIQPTAAATTILSTQAKVELLKQYCDFLFENHSVDSKKECMDKIGPIISNMMDKGECSATTMDIVEEYINNMRINNESRREETVNSLINNVVSASIEGITDRSKILFSKEEQELFSKLSDAMKNVKDCVGEINNIYGDDLKDFVSNWLSGYDKSMDDRFVECFKN